MMDDFWNLTNGTGLTVPSTTVEELAATTKWIAWTTVWWRIGYLASLAALARAQGARMVFVPVEPVLRPFVSLFPRRPP